MVHLPPEDEAVVDRLLHFERLEERPLPAGLRATLRPYQREGWHWLAFLYEHGFGACLADDMGLGKTLQAIILLGGIKEGLVRAPGGGGRRPHLIVVPPSLLFNWESEIRKFFPGLAVASYAGAERSTDFGGADVVLTTYGLVRRDLARLKEIPFDVIVFDEAQAVKNAAADTTGAVRQLQARFKLAMTGTPVENHLGEYVSILDLAVPGLLDDVKEGQVEQIVRRTRPFVLRRTKEQILEELPPKVETDIYLDLTEHQKMLYRRTVESVKSTIEAAYRSRTAAQARIIALTALLRLRQICVSPQLVDPAHHETSPKIGFLIAQLRELLDEGHRALVFSQFTSFLDLLEPELERGGIAFVRLDGSTPTAQAQEDRGGLPVRRGAGRLPAEPQGRRAGAQPDERLLRLPPRPLVEPGRRKPGLGPDAPDRPAADRDDHPDPDAPHHRGEDDGAQAAQARPLPGRARRRRGRRGRGGAQQGGPGVPAGVSG